MGKSVNANVIQLRFLVGYLGEQIKPTWWNSSFFAPGSVMFLVPVFPKTATLGQYHGIQEAATKLHDDRIGTGTSVFHLFRLPDATERQLHQLIIESDNVEDFTKDLNSIGSALKALSLIADCKTVQGVGPVRIGNRSDLGKINSWQMVARYYQQAFETANQTFPYFSEVR